MTYPIVALALTFLVGLAAARAIHGSPAPAFLYGTGLVWLVMFVLPWYPWLIAGALLALAFVLFLVPQRRERTRSALAASPIDAGTVLLLAVFTFYATLAPLWEWDAWAIWALKGRVFFENRGIDWSFLSAETNWFLHPDYPLLVPLNLALPAVFSGEWNDRWLGFLSAAFAISAAAAARQATGRENRHVSATLALVAAALAASPYVGTAETPLIAFSIAALLYLRNGELWPASLLLGLAACTKHEGLTLLVAAAAGLVLAGRPREVLRLWPALALAAPWHAIRLLTGLRSYFESSPLSATATDRIVEASRLARLLADHADLPMLGALVLILLLFVMRREKLLVTTAAVQLAFFVIAYLLTPFDLEWHVATSWPRLSRQLLAIACPAVILGLGSMLRGPNEIAADELEHRLDERAPSPGVGSTSGGES